MIVFAHAGHWIAQLLYLAPVVAMIVAIVWAKLRGRGYTEDEGADALTVGPGDARTRAEEPDV